MEYRSENINELAKALAKAQGEMKFAVKDSENPHYKSKYADLASVIEAIRVPLSSNGLSYTQPIVCIEGQVYVETILFHESNQWIKASLPIHIPKDSKNAMQALGGASTYARRYLLSALVGIAQDDDDGESAASAQPKASPMPSKISKEQIEFFQDQLKFHGEPVASEFMGRLATKNVFKIEDMQAHWFEGAKKVLFELIEKYQGGDQDGE